MWIVCWPELCGGLPQLLVCRNLGSFLWLRIMLCGVEVGCVATMILRGMMICVQIEMSVKVTTERFLFVMACISLSCSRDGMFFAWMFASGASFLQDESEFCMCDF